MEPKRSLGPNTANVSPSNDRFPSKAEGLPGATPLLNPTNRQFVSWLEGDTVLVIEPSANYRASLKRFLANLRIKNLKVVGTVAEARHVMHQEKVGFIICEWAIDEENGLQFCRSLRKIEEHKQTPFLLMSVENLRHDIVLASELRINGYLLKPFSYEDFCAQIETMLRADMNPNPLTTMLELAESRLALGDLNKAEKLFLEALAAKPASARALCGLAKVERGRGNVIVALRFLRDALQYNGDYLEAYREMLAIAEEREDRAGMIQSASVLHAQSPDNPRYTLILARAYLEMGEMNGSLKFFKKTVSLSPRMVEAYKGLGNLYLAREEFEKAKKTLTRAIDLDQGDASLLNSLALAHVRLQQYREGIDCYLMALKLDPNDPRVLFNIGHAHEKRSGTGDLEKARWYYGQALVYQPGFEKAKRGLERLDKGVA